MNADHLKFAIAGLILIGGIAAYYLLGGKPELVRFAAFFGGLLLAGGVAAFTEPGRAALAFARDAQMELRKVVWPEKRETMQATLVVVVMVIVSALFLWIVDMILTWGIKLLTGQGG